MKLYRILFENNVPTSAELMDQVLNKSLAIEFIEGSRAIKSITIYADNDQDGLDTAGSVMENMSGFL
jgi:hypothetical protein